jgi:tetratricopeptide (TPR) repeat protein
MKLIINMLFGLCLVLSMSRHAIANDARVYHGRRGDILTIATSNVTTLMAAGGALPKGGATAGDCFVEARLALKKAPNYYEGDFLPAHNELIDVSAVDLQGKGLGVYVYSNSIRISGAETTGICSDSIDFVGEYSEVSRSDAGYEGIFLYFFNLAHQDFLHLLKGGDKGAAMNSLRPFVDAYDEKWLTQKQWAKILLPALNDYAFALQQSGANVDALSLLKVVIKYDPKRSVAWLNIADAYWSTGDKKNAKLCYQRYAELLTMAGLQAKIPARVGDRIKY